MTGKFWFLDRQWQVIEPLLPRNRPSARRADDRPELSGIVHCCAQASVVRPSTGHRLQCTTVSAFGNRCWMRAVAEPGDVHLLDSTTAEAHARQPAQKGGQMQAISCSRGGRTTKIHTVVDGEGRTLAFAPPQGLAAHRHPGTTSSRPTTNYTVGITVGRWI
jgi:transposase